MTVPSNTIQAVSRVGVREDLSDTIGALFPDDTPFQKAIGTEKATLIQRLTMDITTSPA